MSPYQYAYYLAVARPLPWPDIRAKRHADLLDYYEVVTFFSNCHHISTLAATLSCIASSRIRFKSFTPYLHLQMLFRSTSNWCRCRRSNDLNFFVSVNSCTVNGERGIFQCFKQTLLTLIKREISLGISQSTTNAPLSLLPPAMTLAHSPKFPFKNHLTRQCSTTASLTGAYLVSDSLI